jgi:hypothetical protein
MIYHRLSDWQSITLPKKIGFSGKIPIFSGEKKTRVWKRFFQNFFPSGIHDGACHKQRHEVMCIVQGII